jgi:hypothetical protein
MIARKAYLAFGEGVGPLGMEFTAEHKPLWRICEP